MVDLPEPDLGAPIDVDLLVGVVADRGASADDGELAAPLVPNTKAGTVLNAVPTADPEADDEGDALTDWLPGSRLALDLDRHRRRARRRGRGGRLRPDPAAPARLTLSGTTGGPARHGRGHRPVSGAARRGATSR